MKLFQDIYNQPKRCYLPTCKEMSLLQRSFSCYIYQ